MRDAEKAKFLKMMQATLAIYDKTATTETVGLWWNLLVGYEFADVEQAFGQYLKCAEGRFAPKPASIISIIDAMRPDGRPGADEAWAMIPRDEYTSAVMTTEMAEALGIAQPLLDEGDQVAARMAFKEAYTRLVDEAKRAGKVPEWFPSLGHDPRGREEVLEQAVRLGRLPVSQAAGLLPAPAQSSVLAIEDKRPAMSAEKAAENIAKLHDIIGKSKIAEVVA